MHTMNKNIINLFIMASAMSLLSACGSGQKEKEGDADSTQTAAPVEVVSVTKGKLSTSLQVPGELQPYQQVDLYAKVNSFVKKLLVDVGSEVHEGQLLVTLEAPEINSQLAGAQSRIKQMQALYLASKANYDRLLNTSKTPGTISQNDLDQAEARQNADLANWEAAKSAAQEVTANRNYLEIRAPFSGIITARNVNAGAYVGPSGKGSDLPLLVLQQQSKLRLVISIPEASTGGLGNKDEVSFNVRALPNQKFTAKVARMAGALDQKLRSERLEMDVLNTNKKLLPGMYAEVDVPVPNRDSTFVIPRKALVISTEKVFVIKVDNHKAVWVDVQKGMQTDSLVEVYGDLKPGDQLIQNASDEIRDGQTVAEKPAGKAKE
ncbi:RND family efflux transporter MFP subunit [Mucilaginibacter yixingensis]|uniref:RND family efflux transporter MFP subunit n=2 Tax=Mucilaginibacter yixingensis TaxID=1295612 RepID=A0A2T5J745_9SPHI|nr:RND family efflux transporter MFP subunit [Mucilaginibacter yixingensis]